MSAGAGRYAPSPTGELHLGNLRTALLAWLFARAAGAPFLVRVEDLDTGRVRERFVAEQLDDLSAIGLDWDGEVVRQSERGELYRAALASSDRGRADLPLLLLAARDPRGGVRPPRRGRGRLPGDVPRARHRGGPPARRRRGAVRDPPAGRGRRGPVRGPPPRRALRRRRRPRPAPSRRRLRLQPRGRRRRCRPGDRRGRPRRRPARRRPPARRSSPTCSGCRARSGRTSRSSSARTARGSRSATAPSPCATSARAAGIRPTRSPGWPPRSAWPRPGERPDAKTLLSRFDPEALPREPTVFNETLIRPSGEQD